MLADKGFPHRVQRPFLTRFAALLIHKTHIAVNNTKRRLFRILIRHEIVHGVVRPLIFQPNFKAVLNVCLLERRTVLHKLLVGFLVKTKVQIGLHRADVQRCAHVGAVLLLPTDQSARAKRPKTAEHGNALLLATFADEQRNIQYTHQIIHREIYSFEHRLFFHALAEKFVPSTLLAVQIRFKLPTAFAAQFEQHAHFFQRRGQHHHVTNPVSACIAVHPARLLHQIFHFQPQHIFNDVLHIHRRKADTHIIEQQCQRLWMQPNERVFQPLAYLLRHGLVFLLQSAVILRCQSGFQSHILFGYANLHPFCPKVRYPSPVLQFYLRF